MPQISLTAPRLSLDPSKDIPPSHMGVISHLIPHSGLSWDYRVRFRSGQPELYALRGHPYDENSKERLPLLVLPTVIGLDFIC